MKKIILLVTILFSVFAINGQNKNGYTVTANVTGFPNNTLIPLTDISGQVTIDSTSVVDGKFKLSGKLSDPPQVLRIQSMVKNQFIYATLFIENDEIKISGDIKDFPFNIKMSGSKTQSNLNNLINLTKPYFKESSAIVDGFMKMSDEEKSKNNKALNENLQKVNKKIN